MKKNVWNCVNFLVHKLLKYNQLMFLCEEVCVKKVYVHILKSEELNLEHFKGNSKTILKHLY